ncbi:thioesterase superfamily protein [Roseiarcus fermentans]|uniref:Thioesterase superfamily protein n=1 Tax=Roseiarcus fermentans TaxID=1473586 RepID=A0A366FSX1_9HYPH|nr:thioesterase family protein [Roseiarcus fermentans]RBP17762.1 thioesterase superfamily protein [Roseiarcus fermentans]
MQPAQHALDEAVRLVPLGEGWHAGATQPAYANMAGPFGGVTAAALLNAVLVDPRRLADPIALTVNFCGAIADGEFEIETKLQRGGRTTQHWSMELKQKGVVCTTASAVCGARKPVWSHYPVKGPTAPPRETVAEMSKTGRPEWTRRYSFRFVEGDLDGYPRSDGRILSPRSLAWIEDAPARPLDFLSLAALSDAFFVRIMHARGTFQPMATVSLTTYFHVGGDELAAAGATPLIGEADAAIFHNGFADQTCALWTPDGRLVANGVQITWYKE